MPINSSISPKAGERRFSRDGFVPIRADSPEKMKSNDVTVDIPLQNVPTHHSGYTSKSSYDKPTMNEKSGMFHRHGGKRKAKTAEARPVGKRGDDNEEEFLTTLGKIYDKIYNFSLITRYFLYVFPLAILIAVPIIIGATVAHDTLWGGVQIVWIWTWVEIIWLSLWVSKLFSKTLPVVFQFLCGIVSSGTRKYAQILRALEIPLSLVGWALASWATFIPLMTCNPDQRARVKGRGCASPQAWQGTVSKVFAAFLVASLVFLVEKLLIQMISINYHRKQFTSKIKTSKRNIYLLSLLYDASRLLFPTYCPEFAEEDQLIQDSMIVPQSKAGHDRSGSATPMKLVQNVAMVGNKITSAFGNVAQEVTGKEVFNPTAAHSIVVTALEKHSSSEALAKRLWMSFVVEGKEALFREDLVEVLGLDRQEQAEEAFDAIDGDCNGDISLDEMIMAVAQFGRDRHSIANSVHDVDQAIKVLDQMLQVVVFIAVILIFVGFLNASFTTTLATAGTALLSMSFVFASTAAEVLGSCIFLFVKHPFDVGDRVDISKESLTVEHISLLFSVFKRVDNHKTVQIPNIVLNQNWIENISRSNAMREQVNMFIHFDTTLQDIQLLKNELQAFVSSKENSRDFQPDIEVEIIGIAEMNKLELRVEIKHKSNWSNETLRATRRSKFMCALVLALRKVPIYAPGGGDAALGDVGKPTYAVTVSDEEAARNRDDFAAKKEAKRLVPSEKVVPKPTDDDSSGKGQSSSNDYANAKGSPNSKGNTRPSTAGASERTAVDDLHQRTAGVDAARDDWDAYREGLTKTTSGGNADNNAGNNTSVATTKAATGNRRESEDSNTLGNELNEVRGLLRRESTRGRRRPNPPPKPSVEVIDEAKPPPPQSYAAGQNQSTTSPAGMSLAQHNVSAHDQAYQTPSQSQQSLSQGPPQLQPMTYPQSPYQNSAYSQSTSSHPASSIVAAGAAGNNSRMRSPSNPTGMNPVSPPPTRTGNAFAAGSPIQPLSLVQPQQQQQQQQQQVSGQQGPRPNHQQQQVSNQQGPRPNQQPQHPLLRNQNNNGGSGGAYGGGNGNGGGRGYGQS